MLLGSRETGSDDPIMQLGTLILQGPIRERLGLLFAEEMGRGLLYVNSGILLIRFGCFCRLSDTAPTIGQFY